MSENTTTNAADAADYGTCAFRSPGHTEPHQAERYWNGAPVCWPCWNWNKLDRPAAKHWADTLGEALAKLDMHDISTYLPAALDDPEDPVDVTQFIGLLERVQKYAQAQLDEVEGK